ncbi:MAG: hypothetical protein U0X91_29280 [Spirosomataceae bacterium]
MNFEQILENPHITLSRCKPIITPNGDLHYPFKYTLTYCYYGWERAREIHTNDVGKSLLQLLYELHSEANNGIPREEIHSQIKQIIHSQRLPSGKCQDCTYWQKNSHSLDMGACLKLSGKRSKNDYEKDVYPITLDTGLVSFSINYFEGIGLEYETKSWFGCIHYSQT